MTEDDDTGEDAHPLEGNDYSVGNSGGKPGRSGPPGNTNALGNEGGGAPAGNQNAATHHLHSDPDNVLEFLAEREPEAYDWVQSKFRSYLEDAPFDGNSAKADQLAQICVREYSIWQATGLQVREGVVKQTHKRGSDGEFYEIEDEHPANQAVDRMEKTVTRRLKELGVLDSPDDRAADALGEMANEHYTIVDVEEADGADDDGAEEWEYTTAADSDGEGGGS